MKLTVSFLSSRFATWQKSQDKKLDILRTKRAMEVKYKAFFIIFKGLWVAKYVYIVYMYIYICIYCIYIYTNWGSCRKNVKLKVVKKVVLFFLFIIIYIYNIYCIYYMFIYMYIYNIYYLYIYIYIYIYIHLFILLINIIPERNKIKI